MVLVGERTLTVLNPTGTPRFNDAPLAQRLDKLDGALIGLLDNVKSNAGVFLDRVEELLRERYQIRGFVRHTKPTASRAVPDEQFRDLVRCDAVVTAFGD
jgi:hypothetical protein